jgi:predicted dehydrogenase
MAMEAGKHVVSAVPACVSLEQAQQLLDCKKKTGLRYMMAETSYYSRYTIAARDLFNEGRFGDLFYSEVEYNHPITQEHRDSMWFHNGKKTWRYGYAPMLYPTHALGHLVGVTRERLTQVSAHGVQTPEIEGYGVGKNRYDNPFNGAVGLFSTKQGHMCRCSIIWTGTRGGDRASLYGTNLSYYMPNEEAGQRFVMNGPGAPDWKETPDVSTRLPEALRVPSGHGGSHVFLTHEFVSALLEDREPAINIYEALAMTVPGIIGQQSALKDGESLKVPSFDPTA